MLPLSPRKILKLGIRPKLKIRLIKIQNIKIIIKRWKLSNVTDMFINIRIEINEIINCEEQNPSIPSIKLKA